MTDSSRDEWFTLLFLHMTNSSQAFLRVFRFQGVVFNIGVGLSGNYASVRRSGNVYVCQLLLH